MKPVNLKTGKFNPEEKDTPRKYPLPKWLQQDNVRPVEKEAAVTVSATMKPTDLFKDLPEVIGGALSPLTIPKEILQRTKLPVASYSFKVKDWESNVFSGGGTYEIRTQDLRFSPGQDEKTILTFLVTFGFNEEGKVLGGAGNADVTFNGYYGNRYQTCSASGSGSVDLKLSGERSALSEVGWKAWAQSSPRISKQMHCVQHPDNSVWDFSIPMNLDFTMFDNSIIKDGAVLQFHDYISPISGSTITYTGETRISRQPLE